MQYLREIDCQTLLVREFDIAILNRIAFRNYRKHVPILRMYRRAFPVDHAWQLKNHIFVLRPLKDNGKFLQYLPHDFGYAALGEFDAFVAWERAYQLTENFERDGNLFRLED